MVEKRVIGAFAGGLAVAAIGFVGYLKWPMPTYEECMIEAMRGQPQVMYGAANKTCSRRTGHIETVTYNKGMVEFTNQGNGTVLVTAKSDTYDIMEGSFQVAHKSCEKVGNDDFQPMFTVAARMPNEMLIDLSYDPALASNPDDTCFRTDGLKGRYK